MEKIFFTVGPTQLHPKFGEYLDDALKRNIPSISHRSKDFGEMFAGTASSIRKLLNVPEGFHVFFLGSATEAMERIIENCVADSSFHFVSGAFGQKVFHTFQQL